MNRDQLEGNWKQIAGEIKHKWGKLTDNDIAAVNGKIEVLSGKLQEHYGILKEEADKQIHEFTKSVQKLKKA